jgi:hypothetical protein
MIINKIKILINVFVLPEYNGYQNVISRVHWALRFENNGISSDAFIETFLNIDNIQGFISANQIGNERLLEWVYNKQGGDAFVASLEPFHIEQINYKISCIGQEPYSDGFNFENTQANNLVIPAEVL